jgi:DNA-binding NtrC family response regulator
VDDDAETCRFMSELLRAPGREIVTAERPQEALALLESTAFDLVVSDINLDDDLDGLHLLRAFKKRDATIEVILVSGFGTLETALQAVRAGAFDYVSKPIDIAQVKDVVERALARKAHAGEPAPAAPPTAADEAPDGLVGRTGAMLEVYKQIALASSAQAPVLVTGETGTGKELVARAIHRHGPRSARPFVAVNCGAFAEGVLESELFGHVRGAFTGATADKRGVFEQAHGGTLFLDEVGETSPGLQVRLLRALEAGEVRPVGGNRTLQVDVRAIAATHRNLERAVAEGTFRQDLYYRLNVFRIAVPPLRDRRDDIPLIASHILRAAAAPGAKPVRLTAEAQRALQKAPWPGNVRELQNLLERLAATGAGGVIDAADLPETVRAVGPEASRSPASSGDALFAGLPSLEEMEKRYLKHVLAAVGGNRSRAAEALGIDRRTLYRMAARFGIDLGGSEGS